MRSYFYTLNGMMACENGPWVLYKDVIPIIKENEKLFEEGAAASSELFRIAESFEKYRNKNHDANNAVQVRISRLEVENMKLRDSLKRVLDFEFGAIQEAKAILETDI